MRPIYSEPTPLEFPEFIAGFIPFEKMSLDKNGRVDHASKGMEFSNVE